MLASKEESAQYSLHAVGLVFDQTNKRIIVADPNGALVPGSVIQSEHKVLDTFRNLIMELVKDNQKLNEKEFTVSVELLLAFVRYYKQRFSTFFIMCESLPEEYAIDKMSETVNEAQKKSFVKSEEIYLTKLASNLLKFLKQCRRLQDVKMRKRF